MSRFANLSKDSNEGFQVYTRRSQRYQQDRYQTRFQDKFTNREKKEEKIITEENFPQLSTQLPAKKVIPVLNYILPIINYKEEVKVSPQEIVKEIIPEPNKPFTHEEAQNVFEKIVKNWKTYEDEYINEYGEEEYIKKYGSYLFCNYYSDSESDSEINEEDINEDFE